MTLYENISFIEDIAQFSHTVVLWKCILQMSA